MFPRRLTRNSRGSGLFVRLCSGVCGPYHLTLRRSYDTLWAPSDVCDLLTLLVLFSLFCVEFLMHPFSCTHVHLMDQPHPTSPCFRRLGLLLAWNLQRRQILLSLFLASQSWDDKCSFYIWLLGTWTQVLMHARPALYQLHRFPSFDFFLIFLMIILNFWLAEK